MFDDDGVKCGGGGGGPYFIMLSTQDQLMK